MLAVPLLEAMQPTSGNKFGPTQLLAALLFSPLPLPALMMTHSPAHPTEIFSHAWEREKEWGRDREGRKSQKEKCVLYVPAENTGAPVVFMRPSSPNPLTPCLPALFTEIPALISIPFGSLQGGNASGVSAPQDPRVRRAFIWANNSVTFDRGGGGGVSAGGGDLKKKWLERGQKHSRSSSERAGCQIKAAANVAWKTLRWKGTVFSPLSWCYHPRPPSSGRANIVWHLQRCWSLAPHVPQRCRSAALGLTRLQK